MSDEKKISVENQPTEVPERVKGLLLESGNCAQTSFSVLSEVHNLPPLIICFKPHGKPVLRFHLRFVLYSL